MSEVDLAELAGPGRQDGHLAPAALDRCVAAADFADAYWGRAPLLTRAAEFAAAGRPTGFADLLSPDDVDELLSRRGLRTPFLRVVQDGAIVPPARYTGSGGSGAEIADQVRDERVLELFAGGATLVLQGLHRLWPPVQDIAGRLGTELGCPVQVNAYVTPAGQRGFATHYDTHDVFVLHVSGRKRWRIHPPVLPDPLEREPWGGVSEEVAATADGPPALAVVLAPGDALYLPRGWLHSAEALGGQAVHLTLGLRRPTRYTLVRAMLSLAAQDGRLRAGLPLGVDPSDPVQLRPHLTETLAALRDWLSIVDSQSVAEQLRPAEWAGRRPVPIGPLGQAAAADALHADAVVAARPGLRWRLCPGQPDRVVLALPDRTLDLPAYCGPAVHIALGGGPVRVADLPGLDADDQLVLARRLLREAVVVPGVPG